LHNNKWQTTLWREAIWRNRAQYIYTKKEAKAELHRLGNTVNWRELGKTIVHNHAKKSDAQERTWVATLLAHKKWALLEALIWLQYRWWAREEDEPNIRYQCRNTTEVTKMYATPLHPNTLYYMTRGHRNWQGMALYAARGNNVTILANTITNWQAEVTKRATTYNTETVTNIGS